MQSSIEQAEDTLWEITKYALHGKTMLNDEGVQLLYRWLILHSREYGFHVWTLEWEERFQEGNDILLHHHLLKQSYRIVLMVNYRLGI